MYLHAISKHELHLLYDQEIMTKMIPKMA